ncbi:glycosyltransferase [Bacillus salipaludis]|uniref:glycosyltransferase n=1 Tax=Bacillus salipaludis TaxID=2547811 RepID=UPI003D22BEBB
MSYQIYFIMNKIKTIRGGGTKALLNRANLLSNHFKQINILSFDFNPDYDLIRKELYSLGKIKKNVSIHNLYEFLANKTSSSIDVQSINHPIEDAGLVVHKDKDPKKNAYRLYKDGLYIKYKKYNEDGNLEFIDYFNENRYRIRRENFDSNGKIRQILYMDYVLNKPRQSLYFDDNGHCFLSAWFDPENGEIKRINWFNQDGDVNKVFYSEAELKRYWLEKLTEHDSNPIMLSDSRNTDRWVAAVQNPNVAKMLVIHSNHLTKPYHYGAPLNDRNRSALEMMDQFDAVILLTKEQKNDIEKQFGPRKIYHVIPHSASKVTVNQEIDREPLTAVCLARYEKVKNLGHMIRAFREVADNIPEAKLELWGFGSEEESLRNLIQQLHLESNVFLMGFTKCPNEVYKHAAFSVMTSRSEGFGLMIIESMAVGTPVISYDINYGPRDIITDGIDGILVPPNDIRTLSKAMIQLFTNREKQQSISLQARRIVEKFNDEKFVQEWLTAFENASEQKQHRIDLGQPICTLTDLKWIDTEHGKLKIEGELDFQKEDLDLKDCLQLSVYIKQREKLVDMYIPANTVWKNKQTVSFYSQFSLEHLEKKLFTEEILDVYLSCSARNSHKFIRLGNGKKKDKPTLSDKFKTAFPYYTENGNLSFQVRQLEKKKGQQSSSKHESHEIFAKVLHLFKK